MAKEALFTVADKDSAFDSILSAIRPSGQFMYTDFMATGPELNDPAVAQWQTREPRRPHLWEMARTRNKFEAAKMEVRVTEDITEKYPQTGAGRLQFAGGKGQRIPRRH